MPRIRSIKPEFWTDDKIISLPYIARLFFIGLWNFSDDFGALQDKPEQLRLLILPSETDISANQIIDLLISCQLVDRYVNEESDDCFLIIKHWAEHQKVDHPTKSKIIPVLNKYKKVIIPQSVRRDVALKYKCSPGEEQYNECYFCGEQGKIYWSKKMNGAPSGWVSFSHELSHIIPESSGGETNNNNIVLCCRNCNRSTGSKNAFDWLFNGQYYTNQTRQNITIFRENTLLFENNIESSLLKGGEGKGKEGKGLEGKGDEPRNSDFQLWKIYDLSWEQYKVFLNGKSKNTSEIIFIKWKEFVDFVSHNGYEEIFKSKFVNPIDFGTLLTEKKFIPDKWKEVIEKILATGITPQQNLFFRIPQFLKYGTNKQPSATGRKNDATNNLIEKGQQYFNTVSGKQGD